MTDLFDVPAYGSLSHVEERALFDSARDVWLRYVARGAGRKLLAAGDESIRHAWSVMPRDYQRAVWETLTTAQRDTFKAALAITEDVT